MKMNSPTLNLFMVLRGGMSQSGTTFDNSSVCFITKELESKLHEILASPSRGGANLEEDFSHEKEEVNLVDPITNLVQN